jgi:hypothetical protein
MIPVIQWKAFTPARRKEKMASGKYTYIPPNDLGLFEGFYLNDEIVLMLRKRRSDPHVVKFILDMLE